MFFANCSDNKIKESNVVIKKPSLNITLPTEATFKNSDELNEDSLIVTIDKTTYLVTAKGKLFWEQNPTDTIQLIADEVIEKAYLHKFNDTLFIFYTETDYEGSTSRLVKINLETKQTVWSAEILGFNLGIPYIIDNFAYVTAIGFVGKINLTTGKYQYEFDSLYSNGAFNSFDSIIFQNDKVYFISKQFQKTIADTIIVNEKTKQLFKKSAL
jgi:hypothetical protein